MPTLTDLQTRLASLEAARDNALQAQEYSMGFSGIRNRRADLKVILDEIRSVEMQIARMQGKTSSYPLFGGKGAGSR